MTITNEVKKYLKHLVIEKKYIEWDRVSYIERCHLAALMIRNDGIKYDHEFLTQSRNLDRMIYMFCQSMLGNFDDEDFMFSMRENAVQYFDTAMREAFEFMVSEYPQHFNRHAA